MNNAVNNVTTMPTPTLSHFPTDKVTPLT